MPFDHRHNSSLKPSSLLNSVYDLMTQEERLLEKCEEALEQIEA